MLTVDEILNGVVIDHITAGTGLGLYHMMELEKLHDASVALLQNVRSQKSGKKDIIKIDNVLDIDYSVLGFIDPNITVNLVEAEHVVKKIQLSLPAKVENVIRCRNPRCITSSETGIPHSFKLVDRRRAEYACEYCDELYRAGIGDVL